MADVLELGKHAIAHSQAAFESLKLNVGIAESGTPEERQNQQNVLTYDLFCAGALALDADALYAAEPALLVENWARISVGAYMRSFPASEWARDVYVEELRNRWPAAMSRFDPSLPYSSLEAAAPGFDRPPAQHRDRLVRAVRNPVAVLEDGAHTCVQMRSLAGLPGRIPEEVTYAKTFLDDRVTSALVLAAAAGGPLAACRGLAQLLPHAEGRPDVQSEIRRLARLAGYEAPIGPDMFLGTGLAGMRGQVVLSYLRLTARAVLHVPGVPAEQAQQAATDLSRAYLRVVVSAPRAAREWVAQAPGNQFGQAVGSAAAFARMHPGLDASRPGGPPPRTAPGCSGGPAGVR